MNHSREHIESQIRMLKENIEMSESLIKKGSSDEITLKKLIKNHKFHLKDYEDRLENLKVGRPSLGVTKKVSLTLDSLHWEWLEEQSKGNRSKFLRKIVEKARKDM